MLSSHGISATAFENKNKGTSSSLSSSLKVYQCSPAMATCDGMYPPPFPFVVAVEKEKEEKEEKGDGKKGDSDDAITFLEKKNPHSRDARISFDAGPHIYTIDNDPSVKYTSVTTWNHKHFEEFDADAIITRMMSGKNWKLSKYYGMTRDKIKATWDKTRDDAAAAGTLRLARTIGPTISLPRVASAVPAPRLAHRFACGGGCTFISRPSVSGPGQY
jgi:hypothetical protein